PGAVQRKGSWRSAFPRSRRPGRPVPPWRWTQETPAPGPPPQIPSDTLSRAPMTFSQNSPFPVSGYFHTLHFMVYWVKCKGFFPEEGGREDGFHGTALAAFGAGGPAGSGGVGQLRSLSSCPGGGAHHSGDRALLFQCHPALSPGSGLHHPYRGGYSSCSPGRKPGSGIGTACPGGTAGQRRLL